MITTKPRLRATTDGTHDRFSHYIWKGAPGEPSIAYCGKRWIPKRYDAERRFECPTCREIIDAHFP